MSIWNQGHRIKVIAGHYGSGKTEISLAAALDIRSSGLPAAVVDLDIVNPFFRSAEQSELLKSAGVELFAPDFALTAADIPILGPEILSVFERDDLRVLFDVGGDDAGAAALGRYRPQFQRTGCDMYIVVNPFRPRTGTVEDTRDMIDRIERRARIGAAYLIDNTNLGDETTPQVLSEGRRMVDEVSRATGIPVFCRVRTAPEEDAFLISRRLKPEWL